MQIKSIESFVNEFVGFTRVTTEDGLQGWGQLSTYHSDITAQVLHRQVAPWTLGKPIAELDDMLDLVTEREHKFPGSYICRAMTGLDTAVWDLRAKLVLDHHGSCIQLHLSSAYISFHLCDFSQQNKVHVTLIFLVARA